MREAALEACGCFPTGRHYPGIAHLFRTTVRGLVEEGMADASWSDLRIALVDVETTGKDASVDRVVEVGVAIAQGGELVQCKNWLIHPGRSIPKEASDVHKITDEVVCGAPRFESVAREIASQFEGCIPAAYNAAFDRAFLQSEMARAGLAPEELPAALHRNIEWLDPLVWAREVQQGERSRSLGEVATRLGIALKSAHRASDDAEAALKVMFALGRDVRMPRTYAALVQEQRRLSMHQADERRLKWRTGGG